ncbi:ubiquinol-cytochrome c reductase subunit 9 [Entomortierella parvispora]|uniref:Complex III subunit 9 n=1 Tax=Entomortierella parvispora TaxID=205924 RepID=A0A9P3LYU0_9FUNG|nr:ubiquinol-cytochrome c reductase subunit 9 [Entomortierella parvispora]
MPVKSNNATAANKFARLGYNTIVKRNSIFLTTIFVTAFAAEMAFDSVSDRIWDNINKGRQWKDIAHKYEDN